MKKILASLLSQNRIAGGAAVLALTQLVASVCGFLRDQAFSIMFPLDSDPLGVASVYIAAFRPSDLLFQLTVMSCLSVVLIPFLAGHLAHGRKEEMNRVTTSILFIFGAVFGLLALIAAAIFPMIAPYFVQFTGDQLALYITFGRIALFTNFLFVFGNTFGQYLLTVQRYWIYGLTPILWSLSTIAGTYALTPIIGPLGPIAGTVIGTVIYLIIRYAGSARAGFSFTLPDGALLHSDVREMGLLIIPRMAALGALQLQLLLLDRLASGLGRNFVALNQFASNFESVIPGIVGIAIAQSAFSLLSQSAALKDHARMRTSIKKGLLMNVSLAIPGAIALAILAPVAAWVMRLGGDTVPMFVAALLIYCIAIPFESLNHIILRSFYALRDTTTPAVSSTLSCILAVTAGTLLLPSLSVYALATAYVVGQICQTLLLGAGLTFRLKRLGYAPVQ